MEHKPRASTVKNYRNALIDISRHDTITSSSIQQYTSAHRIGNSLSTNMVRAGHLTRTSAGYYTVKLKNPTIQDATKMAKMAYVKKPAQKASPHTTFDLILTDIRVKELDKRLFYIEAQVERHWNKLQYLENNTGIHTAPKPKPTIRSRFAARYNKFIQSLTIKS